MATYTEHLYDESIQNKLVAIFVMRILNLGCGYVLKKHIYCNQCYEYYLPNS
jgi:hypothetical protein